MISAILVDDQSYTCQNALGVGISTINIFAYGIFKKMLKKINKKWYPQSVLVGSPADSAAVLISLGPVMADFMSQVRSVKLDGIGSLYFTAVSANQIVSVRVRFNPETHYERSGGSRVATRDLTDTPIEWEEWKGEEKKKKKKGVGEVEIHGSLKSAAHS